MIDLGPASSNPTPRCFVRHRNRAYRAGAGRAQGRWHSVSLDSYQPATQAYALSRGVAYLNDIRGFPDAAFYPQLAKSSAKLVVMHSVQDGQADRREAPAGDIMDHIAAFFDARIAALTVPVSNTQPPVLDPGMGFFWGCSETSLSVLARFDELRLRFDLRCFCLFRANPFCARSQAVGPGDVGAATLAAELPPPQVELTSSAHTSRALARRAGGIGGAERNRKNSLTAHSGYFSIFAVQQACPL
ncbi:dihydropteroate synthase [Aliivibrio salmonicida]|uniref:dihydropteroate synthase n=1 Tax=Aliivibrio salmonicida TaxID=40269 RepID=UPI001F5CAED5|nr:dihydropteroate synthase [Aliivibrio salmonicida]